MLPINQRDFPWSCATVSSVQMKATIFLVFLTAVKMQKATSFYFYRRVVIIQSFSGRNVGPFSKPAKSDLKLKFPGFALRALLERKEIFLNRFVSNYVGQMVQI